MLHSPSQILNPFAPRAFGYGTGPAGGGASIPADAYRTPNGSDYYRTPDGSDYYAAP